MKDSYGRNIDYVRFSVTDRCNLRCKYCMPEKGVEMFSHEDILSYEEWLKLAKAFVRIGIVNFKITGGEPLVKRGIADFIGKLKRLEGVREVTLTTNGVLIEDMAEELLNSKIDRINISLDTLNREKYLQITRRDKLSKVLRGIDKLLELDFKNLKINTVALNPIDKEDILKIAELAKEKDLSVRFIELMPIGLGKNQEPFDMNLLLKILEDRFGPYKECNKKLGNGPAKYISFSGFKGEIGLIEALSHNFCSSCNRIRLSSRGFLKLCLHYNYGENIRPLISLDQEELANKLKEIIYKKPERHRMKEDLPSENNLLMNEIGG